ncbi:ABC transporter, partial [Streptomyces lydicus]
LSYVPGGCLGGGVTSPGVCAPAARAGGRAAPPHDAPLTLRIPCDGSQRGLRALLGRLDSAGTEADELTVHTPGLDDVFFALTSGADVPHRTEESVR